MLKVVISNNLSIKVSSILALPKGQAIYDTLKKKFTYKNPDYVEAKKWGRSVYNIEEFIYTYNVMGDEIKIARGGIRKVQEHLASFKVEVEWVDFTQVCEPVKLFRKAKFELREDQRAFIEALKDQFKKMPVPQGMGKANTSFGKTFTMIYFMNEIGQPGLVLVHTTFLQKQWIEELSVNFGIDKKDIGGCGGIFQKPKIGKVNVALYHSMSKKELNILYRDKIGILIVDEGQKASVIQFQEAIKVFRARYRISVSANFERKDGKSFIISDTIGDILYEAPETESNSKIYSNIFGTKSKWHPGLDALNRQIDGIDEDDDGKDSGYTGTITEQSRNYERNILIAKSAVRKIKEKKIVIIFIERKEQAGALAKLLSKFRVHLLIGPVSPKELDLMDIPDKAKEFLRKNKPNEALDTAIELAHKRQLDVIIATQKGEVGLSIETLDHAIVTTPVGNNLERFNQLIGRIERKHKGSILEKFGEKETPTVEVIVDNWDSSFNSWASIKQQYGDRIIKSPYLKKLEK